jgi:hypothetical protein
VIVGSEPDFGVEPAFAIGAEKPEGNTVEPTSHLRAAFVDEHPYCRAAGRREAVIALASP